MSLTLDSRDLRSGGRWTLFQRSKNFALYVLVRCALAIADRLSDKALLGVGRAIGALAHRMLGPLRRTAEDNLRRALPDCDAAVVAKRCFVRAGENLATCILLRRPHVRALELIDVPEQALERIDAALAQGRGAIFVSAHLGPFEAIAAAVSELGRPATVVVRESYDPRLDPLVDRHRTGRGVAVIHRGAPAAAAKIVRALRSGRLVGFLPDLGGRVASLPVRFLGRELPFPVGPQRIARRAGAPLLFGALGPSESAQRLRLEVQALSTEAADDGEMTQRVASALTSAITRLPDHWLWMASSGAWRSDPEKAHALPAFPPAA